MEKPNETLYHRRRKQHHPHASRKAAQETGSSVFSTEEQFADLIGPEPKRLIEIWNGLPGVKPVTKFENRKKATERIWRAIQCLGGEAASPDAHQEPASPATPFDEPVATVGAAAADVAPAQAKATQNATRAEKRPSANPRPKPTARAATRRRK